MSTWSYTKGANRSNKCSKYAPALKVGKKTPELDGTKRLKNQAKKVRKQNKRNKRKAGKIKQQQNQAYMKLASRLYKRLKREPDFKMLPWTELWRMAVDEAKRNI